MYRTFGEEKNAHCVVLFYLKDICSSGLCGQVVYSNIRNCNYNLYVIKNCIIESLGLTHEVVYENYKICVWIKKIRKLVTIMQ